MAVDVTESIDPKFRTIAIGATRELGLRLCGVDIMTPDISQYSDEYVILELNGSPGLDNYITMGEVQKNRVDILYTKILRALEEE
jgi:D-alanine-D-alanine ligase-like ATP-grasp enzyme